jgi:hypothetical protein
MRAARGRAQYDPFADPCAVCEPSRFVPGRDLTDGELAELQAAWERTKGQDATQQAGDWQWGTHSKGSVNVIQRASEALARDAVNASDGRLKLYYRRPGGTWAEATQ